MDTLSEWNKQKKSEMYYHKDFVGQIFIVSNASLYVVTKFYSTMAMYNLMIKGRCNLSMWDLVSRSFH